MAISIPIVAVVSSIGLGGSGLAWLFDKTAKLEMDIARTADRVDLVQTISEVRAAHLDSGLEKAMDVLQQIRSQQGIIRDTQQAIRGPKPKSAAHRSR